MKSIKYSIPVIPVSENSIHDNFYQYFCSVLRCFSSYDCGNRTFILPNKKTKVEVCFSSDEEHLEVLIKSKKLRAGKWEKQLLRFLDEMLEESKVI